MPVYSVSQITRYIRSLLETDDLLGDLWINGEISNLRTSAAGHNYFTLKDESSQLRCVMFRNSGKNPEFLTNGLAVVSHGYISLYETHGDMNMKVDVIVPEGTGTLFLELERLKYKLEQEGLFDSSRKRSLPQFPQTIGLVTSPTGAVYHDIRNILQRRYPYVHILLAPSKVQGDGAPENIAHALKSLNEYSETDLIIVARGGGSAEELQAFNEESVARAIYASRVPVISAIGHETDVTVADLVADFRAPTPSAAAELAVPDRTALSDAIITLQDRMTNAIKHWLLLQNEDVNALERNLRSQMPDFDTLRLRIDDHSRSLSVILGTHLALLQSRVENLTGRLGVLNPLASLARGYAIVQETTTEVVITSVDQIGSITDFTITVKDGEFAAKVIPNSKVPGKKKEDGHAKKSII